MAQVLFPPFFQMLDDTPVVLAGYRVFFYESGTSTKLDTYRDSDLATPNTNPIVLDSEGRFPYAVFGENRDYKVIVGLPSTEDASDPPSTTVYSRDPVRSNDLTTFMEMKVGSGAPTGAVAGTAGSSGVVPTGYWDYTNNIEYRCTQTGAAAAALWTALNASSAAAAVPPPQGYLTPVSATPVITSDSTSATALYYTPDVGNLVPINNGATFTPTEFSELTLTLASQHALNTIYDIFVFSNSGVLTLITGPAWSVSTAGSCARGTGAGTTQISRVKGLYTNTVAITGRNGSTTYSVGANLATYVGSLLVDGTAGQVTCHRSWGQNRKWGIWNAFNKRPIRLLCGDSTASWAYNTATVRQSNAATGNAISMFTGLAEEIGVCMFNQQLNTGGGVGSFGIGYNSTTAYSGTIAMPSQQAAQAAGISGIANCTAMPALGLNKFNALEKGAAAGVTYFGTQTQMSLQLDYRG